MVQFLAVFTDFLRKNNENDGVESIYANKVKSNFDKNVRNPQVCWFLSIKIPKISGFTNGR